MKKEVKDALALLRQLIGQPSFSGEEDQTAQIIESWLQKHGISSRRKKNNVWAVNRHFRPGKPALLLNSHHDTVRPDSGYTNDPFLPITEDGKLYGLGSNDAGGCLVALLTAFVHFYHRPDLPCNLIIAATAEEEISGAHGIRSILEEMPRIDMAVVGEPTEMKMAVAERGLLVIDGCAKGSTGHAAHVNEGNNAIMMAMKDIEWMRWHRFPLKSEWLGEVKMTVTQIEAGKQHNVVPGTCRFVVDVRINEKYTPEEVFDIMQQHTVSHLEARSFLCRPSSVHPDHPLVVAGKNLGIDTFGSLTLSDQCHVSCPSVKIGPGSSQRSHMADEFIFIREIENSIDGYITLLNQLFKLTL